MQDLRHLSDSAAWIRIDIPNEFELVAHVPISIYWDTKNLCPFPADFFYQDFSFSPHGGGAESIFTQLSLDIIGSPDLAKARTARVT